MEVQNLPGLCSLNDIDLKPCGNSFRYYSLKIISHPKYLITNFKLF